MPTPYQLSLINIINRITTLVTTHSIALCGENREKSSSAVFRSNFSTIIGAHPSRTQIKRKKFSPAPPVIFILSFVWDIISSMGGAGADPPSSKKRTFFLMPLALSVPIINKIYHRTKAGERLKLKPSLNCVNPFRLLL